MKILIIGAVAAGTSAAAKARRNNEEAEIKVFEMDSDISYSGCGLAYYIGNKVENRNQLAPRDTKFFKEKYNVDIFIRHEVLKIDTQEKTLTVKNLETQEIFIETYDKLVVSTGAKPFIPNIEGIHKGNVFSLRNIASADKILEYIEKENPKTVLIVGSGFIGLELAENLKSIGLHVTIIEIAEHAMPSLDKDMSIYLEDYLREKGVNLILNDSIVSFQGDAFVHKVLLKSVQIIDTDFVIMTVGVKPNVALAEKAGIAIGPTGAIRVNKKMQTNMPDIYACGDCTESYSLITNKPLYRPLGSTANKMGRIAGNQMSGGNLEFRGILGTGIFKVFDMTVAQTGLTEKEAIKEGFDIVVCHNIKPDKPEYYHGEEMVIKAIADKKSGSVIGVQIIGTSGVDKRMDVFVTAITFGAKAEDLFHLDLAYAPPFSTAKDPVMYTGMILDNAIAKDRKLITADELSAKIDAGEQMSIIDVRSPKQYEESHIENAVNIPQEKVRSNIKYLDKEKLTVTYCNKGVSGNAVQNILINHGFKKVYNLSGGKRNFTRTLKK